MLKLGEGKKWIFQNRAGTPIDHTNARRRYLKPAAAAVGVPIGGWHDFRHTLSRTLRRAGVHPVVIKDTLGHSKVDLAMNVYDKASAEDIRASLKVASKTITQRFATKRFATNSSEGVWGRRGCSVSLVVAIKSGERGRNRIRLKT